MLDPVLAACEKLFSENDGKLGECTATAVLSAYAKTDRRWTLGLQRVAKPQSARCKKAIHAYWLATIKNGKAKIAYLESHRHTGIRAIIAAMSGEPYETITELKDEAKSRAVRICGCSHRSARSQAPGR